MEAFNPNIPRKILWTDKMSMDEFFKLDAVNEYFFEYFASLREEPFAVTLDAVNVFNEIYCQATRLVYDTSDNPTGFLFESYCYDIKAALGWKYSGELVMTMVYWMLRIADPDDNLVSSFTKDLIRKYSSFSKFYFHFKKCYMRVTDEGLRLAYDFKPKPVSPDELRKEYIPWGDFTNDYNPKMLVRIIEFWDDDEDRKMVAVMIKDSLGRGAAVKKYDKRYDVVLRLLDSYIDFKTAFACAEPTPYEELDSLRERIRALEDENAAKQGRIETLEADNARMSALLEKKKRKGEARKFTLVEIVNYCKSKPDYNSVERIVAMLYYLVDRKSVEHKLVDSIDEHFTNMKYGNIKVEKVEQLNAVLGKDAKIQK